jgi:hypothetical protein
MSASTDACRGRRDGGDVPEGLGPCAWRRGLRGGGGSARFLGSLNLFLSSMKRAASSRETTRVRKVGRRGGGQTSVRNLRGGAIWGA